MRLEICDHLGSIEPAAWSSLVGDANPFLEWGWLTALEDSGCVSAETGWLPKHLTVWDGQSLIGACPLYVKGNSQGEFVFDHGWAEAAERAGIRYFPKLLVAIPFTPATGPRLLVHPETNRVQVAELLAATLKDVCRRGAFSSVHVNFCLPEDVELLASHGFSRRIGYQFQWINRGWNTFDDYLSAFRSKRRVQIKRELRELQTQGVEITVHEGDAIPDELFAPMFRLYKTTIDKLFWGRQYLNEKLFDLLRQRWKNRLCFFVARRHGEIVAGTFTVRKGDVLYGRYWGAFEDLRYLHFNVCYYASIDYCVRHGIQRFEPGAGGEFKHLRGFDARPTVSMHWIADKRLAAAVDDYLKRERHAVNDEIEWYEERSAIRRE
ncbi:MAG: N-acetyltransferase [Deltaproteobacteria bacterium]|nr:N-acetyltransferase [Deltaproteobacteria bacterium]